MPLDLSNLDKKVRAAVRHFWQSHATLRAGKNMDGFLGLIADIVKTNGLANADIHVAKRVVTLPGHFRPTKLWDVLVMQDGRLIAAIELKSQVGPSFGNNSNNRAEEALGTAIDFWTAYREHAFGETTRPFLGWLVLLEDCAAARKPVNVKSPHFPVRPEFENISYATRYDLFCRKLMEERLYTSAALILSARNGKNSGTYSSHSELTSIRNFFAALAGHVATEAASKTA